MLDRKPNNINKRTEKKRKTEFLAILGLVLRNYSYFYVTENAKHKKSNHTRSNTLNAINIYIYIHQGKQKTQKDLGNDI